jgi:hypothetical protein
MAILLLFIFTLLFRFYLPVTQESTLMCNLNILTLPLKLLGFDTFGERASQQYPGDVGPDRWSYL